MFNHEPADYDCPFCKIIAGEEDDYTNQNDIVYQNEFVTAIIAPRWWINNPGSILVVSNKHCENIYDISDDTLTEVYKVVKNMAFATRSTYGCDGTSTRQHNEPAGEQDVWHFHVHVFPRYDGDALYQNHENKMFVTAEERLPYANKLRDFLYTNQS